MVSKVVSYSSYFGYLIILLTFGLVLCITRGLGLDRLFLKFIKLHCDPQTLVIAINASNICEVSSNTKDIPTLLFCRITLLMNLESRGQNVCQSL